MKLTEYITLGRSGLRVSPCSLGTMTFGNDNWGSSDEVARNVFTRYVEQGGNFLDTADGYGAGKSELLIGGMLREQKLRDRVVLATKFTFGVEEGNPNSGGNGRKSMHRALEASLKRLQTDYIDLYWMHAWDGVTPVEEVVESLTDLVRAGKIRYYGFSDVPAWYLARAVTLAECRGMARPVALQLEYSLVVRSIEREHVPAALEMGVGICPWSPLASGFLAGKYTREATGKNDGNNRLNTLAGTSNPVFQKFTEKNWATLEVVQTAAKELGVNAAQVSLAWAMAQPGITSTILGARTVAQLDDNLAALEFTLPQEILKKLDEVSALENIHPYMFFGGELLRRINAGTNVRKWRPV
ncbi:aldo/keto reductase [Terriglobus tenax]|uniref:aldo/keto reductase n=1 Tax=Terriglobus tenax TaxID=1111115 RepID=UPI0021DFC7A9|nr:aldo/keto reductase [Terriglobus tenax]